MNFLAISYIIFIMIEDYPNYYPKNILPYMRSLWGRQIARVRVLHSPLPVCHHSINLVSYTTNNQNL